MGAFVPYVFTSAQVTDIRRFCGYPPLGPGNPVYPYPWILKIYQAFEYLIQNMSQERGAVVVTQLANLDTLESAIMGASSNLDTDTAGPWTHNKNEVKDRWAMFELKRKYLCTIVGCEPGPLLMNQGNSMRLVV